MSHFEKKYMTKSVITGMINSYGSAFFAMIFIPLISRNIGMEKYGAWSLLSIFIGLSTALDIGIPKALVYLIPKEKNRSEVNSVFSASAFIISCLMFIVFVLIFLLVYFKIPIWGKDIEMSWSISNLLLYSGVNIICCGLIQSLCLSLLESQYSIFIANIIYSSFTVLNYSVVFAITIFSDKVEHMIFGTNAAYFATAMLSAVLAKIITRIKFHSFAYSHIKSIILKGKDFFFIGIITSLFWPLSRYLVLYLSGDMVACAVYDIALKIAIMASAAITCFSSPLFCLFSGYGEEGIDNIKRILLRVTALLSSMFIVGISLYLIIGQRILVFVFETIDYRLFTVSFILLIGATLSSVFDPYVRALWGLGQAKKSSRIKLVTNVANFVLIFVLIFIHEPLYRIAISIALSLAVGGVMHFLLFYKLYGFRSTGVSING